CADGITAKRSPRMNRVCRPPVGLRRPRQFCRAALLFVTLVLGELTWAAPGDLDLTFNGTGIVTTDIGGSQDEAYGLVVQSDGKIILAGVSYFGANPEIALVRYNPDGTPDSTFGNGGLVTTPVAAGLREDRASDIVLQ